MNLQIVINPQPQWCNGYWMYDGQPYMSDDSMESHLFHNVYGNEGTPLGSIYGDGSRDRVTIPGALLEIADVRVEKVQNVWVWAIDLERVDA